MLLRICIVGLSLVVVCTGCISVTPREEKARPQVTTFWQKLGVPQAIHCAIDDHVNRRGDNPQKERRPRLLRIADPMNLDSPVPAIAAAADVKMQEDLAPQKIKALKYLGMIGCGCYDIDGKITEALVLSLKDCTPAVRMAALEAIEMSVTRCGMPQGTSEDPPRQRRLLHGHHGHHQVGGAGCGTHCGFCGHCKVGQRIKQRRADEMEKWMLVEDCDGGMCGACNYSVCCRKEIQDRLKEMAFGTDKTGCFIEPVAAIRERAAQVLALCPPVMEPPVIEDPLQGDRPEDRPFEGDVPEDLRIPPPPETRVPGSNHFASSPYSTRLDHAHNQSQSYAPGGSRSHVPSNSPTRAPESARMTMTDHSLPAANLDRASHRDFGSPPPNAHLQDRNASKMIPGTVQYFDRDEWALSVMLQDAYYLPQGSSIIIRDQAGHDHPAVITMSVAGAFSAELNGQGPSSLSQQSEVYIGILSSSK